MSSDKKRSKDLGRLFNQIATVTKLVADGKREPESVSRFLQMSINERQKKEGSFSRFPFVSLAEQYEGFVRYNRWLKVNHPESCISDDEMNKAGELIEQEKFSSDVLFYGHRSEDKAICSVSFTAKLAIEYFLDSQRQVDPGDFRGLVDPEFLNIINPELEPAKKSPERPVSFFSGSLPPEDFFGGGIGVRFQARSTSYVRKKIDQDEWLLGFEGIQFLAITHPHYFAMINDQIVPGIILSDMCYRLVLAEKPQLMTLAIGSLWDNYTREYDGCGILRMPLDGDGPQLYLGCGTYTISEKI